MFQSIHFKSNSGLGKIALGAFGLGFMMALHLALLMYVFYYQQDIFIWKGLRNWCIYMISICTFHMMEFLSTASYKPNVVNYESFLLDHSKEYHYALFASWIEFWLEIFLYPKLKSSTNIFYLGLSILVLGHYFRIAAMSTAASNFSHRIEYNKREDHQLVTHGVYRFVRHPSYLGWFYWSIATQILLGNPFCFVAYTYFSWQFFYGRISYEEEILVRFFPKEYPTYKAKTISGIPFV